MPLSKASSESSAHAFDRDSLSLTRSALMRPSTAAPSYSLERSLSLDNTIARACLRAARLARLNLGLIYGQANGWTCHSGHKTLESFSNYIHPTDEGRIVSMQALDNVDGILTAQGSVDGVRSDESIKRRGRKPLAQRKIEAC